MYIHSGPQFPHTDQLGTIHMEGSHSGPACCGETDQFTSVFAPSEVLRPAIPLRMKQSDGFTGCRVECRRAICLMTVTHRTSQAEILKRRRTTGGLWSNVIDLKCNHRQALGYMTISAALGEEFTNATSQIGGYARAHVLEALAPSRSMV